MTTIKSKTDAARRILMKYMDNSYLSKEDVLDFSKFVGEDLDEIFKGLHPIYNSKNHLTVVKSNGEKIAGYGWKSKISGKDIKNVTDLKKIMRKSVSCQTRYVKEFLLITKTANSCYFCGKTEDLVVDHVFPPFDDIANEWMSKNGMPNLSKCPNRQNTWFSCVEQERDWQIFHWLNSNLLLLCSECNNRKSKSKTQFSMTMSCMLNMSDTISLIETDLVDLMEKSDMFSKELIRSLFELRDCMSRVSFSTKNIIPEEFIYDWPEQ